MNVVTSMNEEIYSRLCHRPAVSCIIFDDFKCDSEIVVLALLGDEDFYFVVESAFVVTQYVGPGSRGTS